MSRSKSVREEFVVMLVATVFVVVIMGLTLLNALQMSAHESVSLTPAMVLGAQVNTIQRGKAHGWDVTGCEKDVDRRVSEYLRTAVR